MASVAEIKKKLKEKGITGVVEKADEKSSDYTGSSRYQEIKNKVKSKGLSFDDMGINQDNINNIIDNFINDKNEFFSIAQYDSKTLGWSTASSTYESAQKNYSDLYQRASNIRTWLNSNKSKMDSKTYESLSSVLNQFQRQGSSVVNSFKDAHDYYSKFDTEEDYNNDQIGWLKDDAETNLETVAKRQEKYQSNKNRISEIKDELPWYGETWLPNFVEDIFLSDDKETLRDEVEKLKAENKKYENGQYKIDKYYTPVTDEFTQNGAYRDYSNASMEDLRYHDAQYSTIIENSYGYDYDGNIVDASGRVVYDADDPMVTAMRNNDMDSFWNTVVQDNLGMYLSASQEDLDEAYNRISAHNGNVYDHWAIMLTEGDTNAWNQLTDYEVNLYYHLYKTQGQEAAYQYLEDMTVELTRRATEERADKISEAALLEQIMYNVASVPMNVFGGGVAILSDIGNAIEGKEYNPYSAGHAWLNDASAIRQDTANDINTATGNASLPWVGTTFGDVYQALMSGADSAVGTVIGGNAYGVLMGMSSATSEMKDLYERGASTEQMVAGGILAGAAEMVFEKYSIDSLVKMGDAKSISSVILNALKQGGIEASEEALTEIANTLSDAIVMGSQTDWVDTETFIKNVVNAGIGGFISGGTMGGVMSAFNNVAYNQQASIHGQDIIDTSGQQGVDALKQLALDMYSDKSGVEALRGIRLVGKVADKASARNVGKLSDLMSDTISAQNRSDIQSALEKKGLSKKDAKRVAEYLNKASQGYEFSEAEAIEVESNDKIIEVLRDVVSDDKSSINKRTKAFIEARLGIMPASTTKASTQQAKEVSATKNPSAKESGSEAKIKASESGKIRLGDKEISVKEIASVKDGEVMLRLDDDSTVNARDVEYSSSGEGLIYEAVADMNLNAATANAFVKGYNPSEGLSVDEYILGFKEAYKYGEYGFPVNEMSQDGFSARLSQSQKELAHGLGKTDAKYKTEAKQKAVTDKSSATVSKKEQVRKGRVHYEGGVLAKSMTSRQKASLKGLETLAEALGVDFYVFESKVDANGRRYYTMPDGTETGANGWFKDGSIHIDLYAGQNGEGTMLFTAAHELTHFIREWSPAKFKVFADFLLEQYGQKGISVDERVSKQIEKAKKNGRDIDYDTAYEEVIADSCEAMLADGDAIAKIAELKAKDKTLWQKIKDFITDLVAKIKAVYEGLSPDSVEGQYVSEMLDSAEKLKALWTEALVDASDAHASATSTNSETDSEVKLDDRDSDYDVKAEINESMTMEQAKHMIQRAFVMGGIKEWYDGEYKNGDEWARAQGADEVAMYVENEYQLQELYINKIPGILEDRFYVSDVIEAYLGGTLTGKVKKKSQKLNLTNSVKVADTRFYAPQAIADAKALYEVANHRVNDKNRAEVYKARAKILLYAHNKGAAETLGITQSDLNKKLCSWSNYSSRARDASVKINAGIEESNRWTGIENMSYLSKASVSADEVARMVKAIKGKSDNFQNSYIARTMLSLDTHIDWSWLTFKFDTNQGVNEAMVGGSGRANGYYRDSERLIHAIFNSPNTIAHEMGHALDHQWARDLGFGSTSLTEAYRNTERVSGDVKIWFDQFKNFADDLAESASLYSAYTMDIQEVFARFVAKFVEWTEVIATGRSSGYETSYYNDKFTTAQFVEFARILQGKAALDANGLTANKIGDTEKGTQSERNGDKSNETNYSLVETVDGKLVAVVEDDILSGIYTGTWDKVTIDKAKKAAKTALLKFKGGIAVKGITTKVNKTSRDEYIRSNYSEALRNHDPDAYADKLRAASVADDVVIAATNWQRDGKLKYPRKDDFVDFDRGQTLIMSGKNKYSATVIVGITAKGEFVFYDVEDMNPAQFDIKNEGDLPAVTPDKPFDAILKVSNGDIVSQDSDSVKRDGENILYSDRDSYAPTFYSHMGKVIDDIRIDKMGAGGVVSYLKGKGVKNEEIKWSGIEAFLEGKKSVTKAELQEFIAGSQLVIEEEMIADEKNADIVLHQTPQPDVKVLYIDGKMEDIFRRNKYGQWVSDEVGDIFFDEQEILDQVKRDYARNIANTKWSQYKLDGGENYRELVFKLPDSTYSNRAMRGHWGQDAEGILVHTRIQDMITADGKKMLFIEELQSDWHNEGMAKGYTNKEYENAVKTHDDLYDKYKKLDLAFHKYVRSNDFMTDPEDVRNKKTKWLREKVEAAQKKYLEAEKVVNTFKEKGAGDTADAPFRDTYHEYVLKRLLRMAAEEGYDSIGWTPSEIQSERWSEDYEKAYKIEYDQEMPKFLRKYGKQWGATVGKAEITQAEHTVNGEHYDAENIEVWSMDITDSMKNSVLTEGQPLYSDRDPDSVSNRSLLANALESVAQNDIEKNKLAQYKEKIELIESEQAKLSDLREKIKELSFAKGARDTKTIKELQFEANQAASRINTYDKQLLNLEATSALKGVLEREKEMARKREQQKGKEALARQREKAAETQRELMTRYQESRKKNVESRHKTAMRHKIKDVVNELNQYLTKGTKDKHVPIELQKAVAEALDAVNMDTVGAEERIAKKREEMMRAKTPETVERLVKEIQNIEEMGGNMAKKLSSLKTAYDSIINSDDPLISNSHDDVISSSIDKVIEVVGDTPLRDMSLYQLEAVYDMYKMVLTSVRNANKAFKAKKSEEISVIANRVMAEIDTLGKKKLYRTKAAQAVSAFDWNNLKPVYAFERIGSNTFTEVFNNVRAGEDTWAVDVIEAKDFSTEQRKKYNYKAWDFKKRYGFKSSSGKDFELSLDQIMSLYAYSKREQAKDHLKKGGIVIDETTEVTVKTKLGIPVKFNPTQATAYNLSDETLADIISKLTPEQKAFVDVMQDYLSTTMGEKGNEVSLALYGVKLYKEKNYFPLKSATQFMAKAKEQQKGEVKIKNSGFSKETAPKASNPIVLTPFMDVWANHVNDMSMYHAFVLPLEDFYRVFNYKTPTSDTMATESVEMYLQNAYGKAATQYIDQLLKDLNGGARSDPRETLAKSMMSNFKKASVMASLSVVVQQPTAMVRAMALVDAKYFVGKPSMTKHSKSWAEVKKYAPVAIIKEMGYFDTGMGKGSVEWLKGDKTWKDKMDDVLSKAPALADELTWVAMWNAVKRETLHTHKDLKPNSEEFLKAAGERFTEVITKTQVYDSTLARSANMRSKSAMMNMWTAFMAEPTTSINMLQDATGKFKGNKKYFARTLGAVYGSVILNSALVSIVYAMRDDDEDETFIEKYLSRFTTEVIDGINPLTYIPFVKDIWSIMQGFDVERADLTLVSKLFDSLQQLVTVVSRDTSDMDENELADHNKAVTEAILSITDNLASLVGIPVKNARRDINGIINGIVTITEDVKGRKTTGRSLADNIGEDVKASVPIWGWFPDEKKSDKLYEAIVNGDKEYQKRLESGYETKTSLDSAIRKALRDNDPRIKEAAVARYNGDIAEYMRIAREIIAEGHFSQDNVVAAINAEINAMDKGETTPTPDKEKSIVTVEDYYNALVDQDEATAYNVKEDIITVAIANGKDRDEAESSFINSFTNHIKDEYEDGNLSDHEAKNMLTKYGDKTEDEADSKVRYWDFKQEYPDYELTESAVTTYYEDIQPSGISISTYYDYYNQKSKCKGTDSNGDGRADSGTVKAEIMAVINSLPLTSSQKDALYFANGWASSTLYEAPWH